MRAGDDIDIGHVSTTGFFGEPRSYATTSIGGSPYGATVSTDATPDTTIKFIVFTDIDWSGGGSEDGIEQILLTTNGDITVTEQVGSMLVGHIHSTGCRSDRLPYSLHFINEESIGVVSLLNSEVFKDFPTLKSLVSHGGGANPYQYARFEALVGLDAATGKRGRADVRIRIDGKEVDFPALRALTAGPAVPVRLDVRGAKELVLVIDFGPTGGVQADVNWGDARLIVAE